MQRGGLAAGCFAAYVPQAARTPENEAAAFERAIGMLHAIRSMGRDENGVSARVTATADEIEAAKRDGVLAIVPAVENGFAIGGDLSRLARFRALGARYLTLTHNGHNALADSCNPRKDLGDELTEHGGLSPLGRAAIAELNRLGMLVDVAHVSRDTHAAGGGSCRARRWCPRIPASVRCATIRATWMMRSSTRCATWVASCRSPRWPHS